MAKQYVHLEEATEATLDLAMQSDEPGEVFLTEGQRCSEDAVHAVLRGSAGHMVRVWGHCSGSCEEGRVAAMGASGHSL